MKQPITVTVARQFGNSGDVITTFTSADGEVQKVSVPGDCTPYTAVAALRETLEKVIDSVDGRIKAVEEEEPIPDTEPGVGPTPAAPAEAPAKPKRGKKGDAS